jgi:hypothetical protein
MEPTDLNSSSATPDELEQRLLASAGPALADDGFSQRVLAALPARRRPWGQTWMIPGLGAAVGLALSLGRGASPALLVSATGRIGSTLAEPTVLSAIVFTACAFALLQIFEDA